jgi:uncharacterized membrane protein YgaE (UPF0421/DUF939 family)
MRVLPRRRRVVPEVSYIARLTITAVFAYLLALLLPGSDRPVLAPLTALLVVQATLFHTIRSAGQRVAAVTCGVLVAIAVSDYLPFNTLVLAVLVAGALAIGTMLRLGSDRLEVPISAMVIFSSSGHAAASSRIADTLVGAAAGLVSGLVFAPLRVEPAREFVAGLADRMAELLGQIADGLDKATPSPQQATNWLNRSRELRNELEQTEDALNEAEDSVRMNPRRMLHEDDPAAGLRDALETLDRAASMMRVLARTIADSARIDSTSSPVRNERSRSRLAGVLRSLAAAIASYSDAIEAGSASAAVTDHLAEAQRRQHGLAEALRDSDSARTWPLRGEILAQVDRLRRELEPSPVPRQTRRRMRRHARPLTAPVIGSAHDSAQPGRCARPGR